MAESQSSQFVDPTAADVTGTFASSVPDMTTGAITGAEVNMDTTPDTRPLAQVFGELEEQVKTVLAEWKNVFSRSDEAEDGLMNDCMALLGAVKAVAEEECADVAKIQEHCHFFSQFLSATAAMPAKPAEGVPE
eukprot:comp7402_c0_seq1/m.3085 comp7402_c0_seq1/g.3085  ORF comp7402_c0_seq1/g.3085 comp7402_c0_seq1/m.3085 type:complete len:134 (-) comp7402_c0_seq1:403-804(-)